MTSQISESERLQKRRTLEKVVLAAIGTELVTREQIGAHVLGLAALPIFGEGLNQADLQFVSASVETKVNLSVGEDTGLVAKDFVPWLDAGRYSSIDWARWEAYSSMLQDKAFSHVVIDRMKERADKILEFAGDPKQPGTWARRGLVIGDVQSGKTANYLALFNKAADAGYKIIILFGGHTDKLRQQTQERIDEGFIGRDSRPSTKNGAFFDVKVGVGKQPGFVPATGMTTWLSDFSAAQLHGSNLAVVALNGPVIFVIKKNKKIIENLIDWLRKQAPTGEQSLDFPMLLLDDEADYASINTSRPDDDPTKINQAIRDLLAVFKRNSYVGFTATPFANVFIDPEAEADLFPKDYIFSLESPSNYFGPEQMFEGIDSDSGFQVFMTDAQPWLPYNHKSGTKVGHLPKSLKDAVASFFISNTIRDLRGDESEPRTMMINASRFKSVQRNITTAVEELVSNWRASLHHGVDDQVLNRIKEVFASEYSEIPETWEQVSLALSNSIEHIKVVLANSDTTKSGEWETVYRSDRARVIAVGGDVLSRGLTLPGLMVSYFHRRSLAYDTLMQMGRWFGYRGGYSDICKLWIDTEISDWYKFISDATTELRGQIQVMRTLNQTPKEFGLRVRRHPGAALVATALNKRRTAEIAHKVSLRNKSFESVRLMNDPSVNNANFEAAKNLIDSAKKIANNADPATRIWEDVDCKDILTFFQSFRTSEAELVFADKLIEQHLLATKAPWMESWTLILVSGSSDRAVLQDKAHVRAVKRAMYLKDNVIYAGGKSFRLGGKGDEGIALSEELRQQAATDALPKAEPSDMHYRKYLQKPLLILYVIDASVDKADEVQLPKRHKDAGFTRYLPVSNDDLLLGVHVAFPIGDSNIEEDSELVSWLVNKTWLANNSLLQLTTEEDEEE